MPVVLACVSAILARTLVAIPLAGRPSQLRLVDRCLIPDVSPGKAQANLVEDAITLSNDALEASWLVGSGVSAPAIGQGFLVNKLTREKTSIGFPFALELADGKTIWPFGMKVVGKVTLASFKGTAGASRLGAQCDGVRASATLVSSDESITIDWSAILLNSSNYVRQEIVVRPKANLQIKRIVGIDTDLAGVIGQGSTPGAPLANGTFFFGIENPMSECETHDGRALCTLKRLAPIRPEAPFAVSIVAGVSTPGQMRRAILNYVERERAHPYRTFLNYNSWYDIGYFTPYTEADCLGSIEAFGQELIKKRDVPMESFLFDDGWDDTGTVWEFNRGFPVGFLAIRRAARNYGAEPGVWLSPFGGYGPPQSKRIATGKKQGYETNEDGYALSGPKYFAKFREVCLSLLRDQGVNMFKVDGMGPADRAYPGSAFDSDFDAAIKLIEDLRAEKPDLYVNLTSGTWPSPFWLRYCDSTYRDGWDHSFAGVGTKRQQWMTFRDGETYKNVVSKAKFYPLNSLMLHGVIYAKHARDLNTDPGDDFASELHSYFGTGAQLQELYVSHELLSEKNWDDLAETAKWARENAAILIDSHWIGGDPNKLEVYGWACWSPKKAIVTLRNPSDKPQTFKLDLATALELPERKPRKFAAHSPFKADAAEPAIKWAPDEIPSVALKPFEVRTIELAPSR